MRIEKVKQIVDLLESLEADEKDLLVKILNSEMVVRSRKKRKYSFNTFKKALELRSQGMKVSEIARATGIREGSLKNWKWIVERVNR